MIARLKQIRVSEIIIKKNVINFALRAFLVLLPFLCAWIISFCFGYKGSLKQLFPVYSDEYGWFSQVESIINYGAPLGYYGYNESYSQIGTFGPWGIAPLLPYALFGKIFGWHFNTMALANISFLSVSLLLFILLTKPSNKQVVYLSATYVSLFIAIGYSLSSMSEGLRYACAIVLTGFIIWIERYTKCNNAKMTKKQKILLICGCVATLYCVQVYLIFSLAVFIISLFILRKTKMRFVLRFIASAAITLVVAAVSQTLVGLVCCPYLMPSTIQNIIEEVKTEGIYSGICFILSNFFNNLSTVNFPQIISNGNDILVWYFLLYVVVLFFLLKLYIFDAQKMKNDKSSENIYSILSGYFLLGFLVGYCLLYTGSEWTLCRGTNTGLIMALFFLVFSNKKKYVFGYALGTLFAIVSVWSYFGDVLNDHAYNAQFEEQIYEERGKISEVINISPELSEWENTIAIYVDESEWLLSLPQGAGWNSMWGWQICEKSKYAIMHDASAKEQEPIFNDNGYILIYTDDVWAVFINEQYL